MIDLTASDSEIDPSSSEDNSPSSLGDEDADYGRWKDRLLDCLGNITCSGDFSVSRKYQTFVNPCLRIPGHADVIPLPVTDRDAAVIRGACKEAPFGRGDETLVDPSVRKTWELDAWRFQCANPSWPAFFRTILDDIGTGLGVPNIHAEPYKLLLYEKGSFFKRHKDSEKDVGMIATLVICLPAIHSGGGVHLSFGSERREIATAPASSFDVTALAWFSDVYHEIKPLDFGHRLVLTYKLFQSGGIKQSAQAIVKQSQELKSILRNWRTKFPDKLMLAYPLEHQYTKSSLSLKNMKGRDRVVCRGLKEISAECDVYLTLAHMTHTEEEEDPYYRSGDGEESTTLDTIYSCEGAQIGSTHDVDESEILGSNLFKERDPDSEDEGEFTGNEGAAGSFRYHDTVAVLIPKHQIHHLLKRYTYSVAGNEETENLLSMVKQDFAEHRESPVVEASTLRVMNQILDALGGTSRGASAGFTQSTMPCNIAKWAVETHHMDLYQKALTTALSCQEFPTKILDLISYFLGGLADNADDIDWKIWFGPFLRSTSLGGWHSASRMFTARLASKPLQDSFNVWAQAQLDLKFDTQTSFTINDHDFFLKSVDRAVGSDRMVSAFASRGTNELIFKVLESIFERRGAYSDGVAKGIFENTLDMASSRLVLQTKDIPMGAFGYLYPGRTNDQSRIPCQRFTALIKQCLALGVSHHAIGLMEESHKVLSSGTLSWDRSGVKRDALVLDLLEPLASALHSHCISPTPGIRGFFEFLIRDVLEYKLPAYPKKPKGWCHKPQGCGRGVNCADCTALNAFLVSEDQESWSFTAAEPRRKHIDMYLPSSLFRTHTIRTRSPYTLVVEKLGVEHKEEVKKFSEQLKGLENALAPLTGDIIAGILGDATYRELVLLENLKTTLASAPVAGVKRPSESNLAGDSVRRRW